MLFVNDTTANLVATIIGIDGLVTAFRSKNLVQLQGWCVVKDALQFVYEFMLHDSTLPLPVHLSKQHLLLYGYDKKNGMYSFCLAIVET